MTLKDLSRMNKKFSHLMILELIKAGKKYKEISNLTGISEDAIKQIKHRNEGSSSLNDLVKIINAVKEITAPNGSNIIPPQSNESISLKNDLWHLVNEFANIPDTIQDKVKTNLDRIDRFIFPNLIKFWKKENV